MDPLSTMASVIAILTLAAKSCKTTYGFIDELAGIPQVMANSKSILSITQKTYDSLQQNLEQTPDIPEVSSSLESFLRQIPLKDALQSAQGLSDEFSVVLEQCTKHSTGGKFSARDRLTVSIHETKIQKYNKQLSEYQQTVNAVVNSIILEIARYTSGNVDQLRDRFMAQEQALLNLSEQLRSAETESLEASIQPGRPVQEAARTSEDSPDIQRAMQLRELCEGTLAGTKKSRTGQTFGEMLTAEDSRAFQGISGAAQDGVEQSFGKLTTQKNSKAAQGQISSEDFGKLFS